MIHTSVGALGAGVGDEESDRSGITKTDLMTTRKKYFHVLEKVHELKNKKPSERTVISLGKHFMANPGLRIFENFRQLIFVLKKQSFISINKSGDQSINDFYMA
jgi:hypothetical protein